MIHLLMAKAGAVHTDQINDVMLTSMKGIITNMSAWPGHIWRLTLYLILIEVAVAIIYQMFKPDFFHSVGDIVPKALKIITVVVITSSYPAFTSAIMDYVVSHAGSSVGQSGVTEKGFNPAAVASSGIEKVSVVFDKNKRENIIHSFIGNEKKKTPVKVESDFFGISATLAEDASEMIEMTVLGMLAFGLFLFLAMIVIMVHFYIAAMIFVFTIEFYIVVSITSCFLPFGINKHTSYLFSNAINAVIGHSVKLAVLAAVLGLLGDPLAKMSFGDKITLPQMLSMVAMTITVGFMVHRVPAIASGVFPGGGAGINLDSVFSGMTNKAIDFAKSGAEALANQAADVLSDATPNMAEVLGGATEHMASGASMFIEDGREPLPAGQPDHPMAGGLSLSELAQDSQPHLPKTSGAPDAGQVGGLEMYGNDDQVMAQTHLPDAPAYSGGKFDLEPAKQEARDELQSLNDEFAQLIVPDGGTTLEMDLNEVQFFELAKTMQLDLSEVEFEEDSADGSLPDRFDDIPVYEDPGDQGPPDWGDVPIDQNAPYDGEPQYDPSYEDYDGGDQ